MSAPAWSTPFCGVQHLNAKTPGIWATVADYGTFAKCSIWTPGCGFEPRRSTHANAEEARVHAERALAALQTVPA